MVRDSLFLRGRGYRTEQQPHGRHDKSSRWGTMALSAYDLVKTFYFSRHSPDLQ
jgi:hypothetical protein